MLWGIVMHVYCLILVLRPTLPHLAFEWTPRETSKRELVILAPSPACLADHIAMLSPNHLSLNQAPFPQPPIIEGRFPQAPALSQELGIAALHSHLQARGTSPVFLDPQPIRMTPVFLTAYSVAAHSATVARPRRCTSFLPMRILGWPIMYRRMRAPH